MKTMDPAKRNKFVSIVNNGQAPGDGGIIEEAITVVWSGFAAIWPVSSKEARENMRIGATVTHNIRMPYRQGIKHDMHVIHGTREFEIKGIINPDEAGVFLDLVCEEKF